MNPPEAREQMAEIMFETFNVAGLYIGVQATLALYAQICSTGGEGGMEMGADNMTGAVIDSGDGVTHVFPVCDGYVIGSCVKSIPLAGSDMTKFIADEIKNRREDLPQGSLSEIAQKIKEDHCYVAKDLMSEFQKFDEKPEGEMVQSSRFKTFVHKTLSNKMCNVDVGYERFLAPEMFFHPEFMHPSWTKPLEQVVDECIQACPIHYRLKLYNNIVLSGGSTLFTGFDKRLQRNLQNVLDSRQAISNALHNRNDTQSCKVSKNLVQAFAVWFGGSMIGSMDNFPQICKSREQYLEDGPSICRFNPIFNS